MPEIVFLGTSDAKGVPRFFCSCAVCNEARSTGKNNRSRASILIRGEKNTLLDMSYDLRWQLNREGIQHLDAVYLTHAHNDHILGFGDVYDFMQATGHPVEFFAAPEVGKQVLARFPYAKAVIHSHFPEVEGYTVQAFLVPHGANGSAYAFKFVSPAFTWAYITDSIAIPPETEAHFLNLNLLILGTCFWHEPYPFHTRSLYDVQEALQLDMVKTAQQVFFTHLSHDIDATQHPPLPTHVSLARDGLRYTLG